MPKKKQQVPSMWRKYVKYLIKKNPGKALKQLLKNYSKSEYEKFKKKSKTVYLNFFLVKLKECQRKRNRKFIKLKKV